jgi:hypothetical protein
MSVSWIKSTAGSIEIYRHNRSSIAEFFDPNIGLCYPAYKLQLPHKYKLHLYRHGCRADSATI